ncbi:MAG: tetratricopeptide repeat protein [Rhodocyclaceae bacterium]|jgi:predicted negative regulator of RcsB-dependent stress response|nr:tetratricopeptide repeat protein [Rhodocyclaceae bacterium]MCE2981228.1 tetratricopeptide repeat protein [Betaproteobacteria bacterium]MCA3073943.1 tetratricopeptide repeat protein [Rhodocyclaceae bacterium]MCA3089314.1 tetratricopeptide repeat protein [Rhodocyclaceae bacterium]MCA3092875.1 tetratricopeptide repeat protein [Rhodocyclaceae bacterium]
MAHFDLEQQEQIDAIKTWWERHGNLVTVVVVVVALATAGLSGWRWYQNRQTEGASLLYLAVQEGLQGNNQTRVREAAAQLTDKYPGTGYAVLAALIAARLDFEGGDTKAARTRLEWAIANAKQDEFRDLARLRLAAVLVDDRDLVAALRVLDTKRGSAFDALFLDLRGDVLLAQGDANAARNAYQLAFDKLEEKSPYRNLVQLKLDALGEAR